MYVHALNRYNINTKCSTLNDKIRKKKLSINLCAFHHVLQFQKSIKYSTETDKLMNAMDGTEKAQN